MYFVTIKNNQTSEEVKAILIHKNGPVTFIGNYPNFLSWIRENNTINERGTGNKLYPKDGMRYLQNLQYNFNSGYLEASVLQEA